MRKKAARGRPHPHNSQAIVLLLLGTIACSLPSPSSNRAYAAAPITPSGLNTQVNLAPAPPPGKVQYDITGGTRPGGGANLFHSFGDFNVPNNNIANFLNDSGLATSNILGRVTGGNLSSIFGTIQTTGFGNANLFLINPAGFLFGPNATVNVGGMVSFSSADYLRLADGVRFNAVPNAAADALLSTAPVAAYGFLGSNPGAITVQGSQFTVTEGTGISLVGGNIAIQSGTPDGGVAQPAQLVAPNGKIQLASAASPGEFDAATLEALPNADGASFTSFGSVSLAPGSNINVRGTNTVSIRGGQFILSVNDAVLSTADSAGAPETIALSRGSSIVSSTSGLEAGADVQLVGRSVSLDGASITSITTGDGAGGAIRVTAEDNINLANGAQLVSKTEGNGVGGNIAVEATSANGSITISGSDLDGTLTGVVTPFLFNPNTGDFLVATGVYSLTSGTERGGNISISAPNVSLEDGAVITSVTSGDGRGGNITISGGTVQVLSGAQIFSVAGLDFTAPDFELKGTGNGGDINISATDSVTVSGGNLDLFALTNISSYTFNPDVDPAIGQGHGGIITISAPSITISDAGAVASTTSGSGTGGTINIDASNLLSVSGFSQDFGTGSAITSGTFGGNGGSINITGSAAIIEGGSFVASSSSSPTGNGGDINFNVGNLTLATAGSIASSSSQEGSSGHIQITATGDVSISGKFVNPNDPGAISWSTIRNVANGSGSNGGIDIHAGRLIMSDGPQDAPSPIPGQLPSDDVQILSETEANTGGFIRIVADESISMSTHANIVNRKGSFESGSISLTAPSITLSQSAIRGRTNIDRDAGAINLTATAGDLTLLNNSHVLESTQFGAGKGGAATLQAAGSIIMSGGSTVESESRPAATGDGGTVTLIAGNEVNLSGIGTALSTTTGGSGNGGNITVQGQSVTLSNNASISANTTGQIANAGKAGEIVVKADSFTMNTGAKITASSTGSGTAGSVTIEGTASPAQSVLIDGAGSGIFTDTSGTGAGGNIFVNANTVTLSNGGMLSATTSGTEASAAGGTITVAANQIEVSGESMITTQTFGPGSAGQISVTGDSVHLNTGLIFADTFGDGNAGSIDVQARIMSLEGFSAIGSSSFDSSGNAGSIQVRTTESLSLTDSGINSLSDRGTGNSGQIFLVSPTISLGASTLSTMAIGHGNAGTITLETNVLTVANSSSINSSTAGQGQGGTITVRGLAGQGTSAQEVTITDNSEILTQTSGGFNLPGEGAAGSIFLATDNLNLSGTSKISAETLFSRGHAGNIDVTAGSQITIDSNSEVSSRSTTGVDPAFQYGDAGQVTLRTPTLSVSNGGFISTSTETNGAGGSITLNVGTLNLSSGGQITSGSVRGSEGLTPTGSAGNVTIQGLASPAQSVFIDGSGSGVFTDTQGTGAGGNILVNANTVTLQNGGTLSAATSGTAPSATGGTITVDANQVLFNTGARISAGTTGAGNAGEISITGAQSITLNNSFIDDGVNTPFATGNGGQIQLTSPTIALNNGKIRAATSGPGNAGSIDVAVDNLSLTNNSQLLARTTSGGNAGDISIHGRGGSESNAQNVTLDGSLILSDTVGENLYVEGNAGNISIRTGQLTIMEGSGITTAATASSGSAGNITINAVENVNISQSSLTSNSEFFSLGNAGKITVTSPSILVENEGIVSTSTDFVGNAGDITFNTGSLRLTSGGILNSSSLNIAPPEFPELIPTGKAGNVTIQGVASPANSVLIDGSGSGVFTETQGTGAGGSIVLNANTVTLQNGGTLSAKTSGTETTATGGTITVDANQVQLTSGALITASTTGAGAGGSITIGAGNTFASNAATVSSTTSQATGGDIAISAGQAVTLDNGSLITASSSGAGNAGNIVINAGQSYTSTNSKVTTQATAPNTNASGGNITINASNLVWLRNSELNASVQGSSETIGGTITIDPQMVILQNSQILAKATNGNGGTVNIVANVFQSDANSQVNVDSQFGQSGTITIQSPIAPAGGKIIPLSQKPLLASTLFNQRCAALAGGNFSTFTLAGRDTLPAEPGGWISSPLALGTISEQKGLEAKSERDTPLLSLRQIAPPGFLTQVFATDASTGCGS